MQLAQRGRLVVQRQTLLCRLQMRVACATKPNICFGVVALRNELRQSFARTLERHIDLHARGAAVNRGNHAAPFGLYRTNDVDLLRLRCESRKSKKR